MICPNCGGKYNSIEQTNQDTLDSTVRHRRCKHCQHRWWTLEVVLPSEAIGRLDGEPVRRTNYQRIRYSAGDDNSGVSNRWRRSAFALPKLGNLD